MRLSDLFRSDSADKKPCSSPNLSRAEDALVELVLENGQILGQSQSNRVARRAARYGLPSNVNRFFDASSRKIGFGGVQSIFEDMLPVVPSEDLDLCQDDDHGIVPWLRNYPPRDFNFELISGVTANGKSVVNSSILSADKTSIGGRTVDNSGNNMKPLSSRAQLLCSWPFQHQSISEALRSGVSDVISRKNVTDNLGVASENAAQGREIINDSVSMKMGKQVAGKATDNSNLLNFCHFSRPASVVKPAVRMCDPFPASVSSGKERVEIKEKSSSACSSKPVNSKLPGRSNIPKDMDFHVPCCQLSANNSRQPVVREPKESFHPKRTRSLHSRNEKFLVSTHTANSTSGVPEGQTSVGSGNGTDRVSSEKTHTWKRKFHDIEESEWHSDDIETESVDNKKPTPTQGATGSKRRRAAEVHNFSERRRRDQINEKMQALQELIPYCNKVDKVSVLDEAIEYLKALQLQVQIMSMGTGLCIPPMLFPTGMQYMHPAHVPHFSAMGGGIRYGMGMLDMLSRIPGCPIFPVPPMQAPHFPLMMSGMINFQRIPAPNLPAPGQGLYNSVAGAPSVPLAAKPPITLAMDMSGLKSGSPRNVSTGDPITDINSQSMFHAKAVCSMDHKSNQMQATEEVLKQPFAVQENKYHIDAGHTRDFKNAGCD